MRLRSTANQRMLTQHAFERDEGTDMGSRRTGLLLGVMASAGAVHGAERMTDHTYRLADGETPPSATLDDAAWLVGSWQCEAFGERCEEAWNAPSAGSMVGLFKLFDDEEGVRFYELLLLTVDDGTLVMKVKHFNADFSAWEEKADYVSFPLVAIEPDALHFRGLSFYRRGPDAMDAWLVLKRGDESGEHLLRYWRTGTARD